MLKRCPNLRHLNLAFCPYINLPWINIKTPKLEVLNLSLSRIDNVVMYAISKISPRLQKLDLERCYGITEKGVKLVVENCTHLREINLRYCRKVSTNNVDWMIFLRPSLSIITALPHFRSRPINYNRKLLFGRCLVC